MTAPEQSAARPTFSVTMPAYDAAATIASAIESVLSQTLADWELVIVDDGSADATAAIASEYASRDSRIRLIQQDNSGTAVARNTAWRSATGLLISRLDADDILLPTYLETFRRFIAENPGYDIYACNAWRVRADDSRVLFHTSPRFSKVFSLSVEDMLRESQIFTAAVSPRQFLVREGGYRPGVYVEEYDLWLRAMARGARHIYVPTPLVLYRDSGGSQMTGDAMRVHESQIGVLQDAIGEGLLTQEQTAIARHSIRLLRQNVAFRRATARVLGKRGSALAVALAQRAAWILRPYRSKHD